MKKQTLKMFINHAINHSSLSARLIRATILQFGDWDYFKQTASDIAQYGAAGSFNGFIYYTDTLKFTRNNKKPILDLCFKMDEQIENIGSIAFIASFNCLKGVTQDSIARAIYVGKGDDSTQVLNALAWFALEEVAKAYCDFSENEEA